MTAALTLLLTTLIATMCILILNFIDLTHIKKNKTGRVIANLMDPCCNKTKISLLFLLQFTNFFTILNINLYTLF